MKVETRQRFLFALIMGVITTGLISCILVISMTGLGPAFIPKWLKSWALAYMIVVPVILFVGPCVQSLVSRITSSE